MTYIFLLLINFNNLDSPTYLIREQETKEIIKLGISILPEVNRELEKNNSLEKKLRLQYIKHALVQTDELEQHKNLLRRNKKSTLTGWSHFTIVVGYNHNAKSFYYFLYKVHSKEIKLFFNSDDKKFTAMVIAKELRTKRAFYWEDNSLLYLFECLLDIDLGIKKNIGGYYNHPPEEYKLIYERLRS